MVAAGWGHTCILTAEKSIRCWGNNEYGQLGYGEAEPYRFTPMDVPDLEMSAERISADGGTVCALTIYGSIRCWGNNKYGQLGNDTVENCSPPVDVSGLAQDTGCGDGMEPLLRDQPGGGVLCWGWNLYGQLGDGTNASRATPTEVYGLEEGVEALGVGWEHTCAVAADGGVKCWGANDAGQLGDGSAVRQLNSPSGVGSGRLNDCQMDARGAHFRAGFPQPPSGAALSTDAQRILSR